MNTTIDFNNGGYQGDGIENAFKPYTTQHMPFWWQFREVIRASQEVTPHWKKIDGSPMSDTDYRELIGLSLLNYAVYTGHAESIAFCKQMVYGLSLTDPVTRLFEVRRSWKATYSSLYTSFNALCNIICVVVGCKPLTKPAKKPNDSPKNYMLGETNKVVRGKIELTEPLDCCSQILELRHHLDHFWTVWQAIGPGHFFIDTHFKKGYLPIRPATEVSATTDAVQLARTHIDAFADNFGLIYQQLAITGGWLDKYLVAKGWRVDYSDYKSPHNGQRPLP